MKYLLIFCFVVSASMLFAQETTPYEHCLLYAKGKDVFIQSGNSARKLEFDDVLYVAGLAQFSPLMRGCDVLSKEGWELHSFGMSEGGVTAVMRRIVGSEPSDQ